MKRNFLLAAVLLTASVLVCPSCNRNDDPVIDDPSPTNVAVTGVTLNKTAIELDVNGHETLTATVAPGNASLKTVTWSSSKESVAKSPPSQQVRLSLPSKLTTAAKRRPAR